MRKRDMNRLAEIHPGAVGIQRALERIDWAALFRRADEAIAPQIEAYRIARLRIYAQARFDVFV